MDQIENTGGMKNIYVQKKECQKRKNRKEKEIEISFLVSLFFMYMRESQTNFLEMIIL